MNAGHVEDAVEEGAEDGAKGNIALGEGEKRVFEL